MGRRLIHAVSCAWIGLAVVAAGSCRQLLGIDEDQFPAAALLCGSFEVPPGACFDCLAAACCDGIAACAADEDCASLFSCLGGCVGDVASIAACRTGCRQAAKIGTAASAALACEARNCEASCGLTCGGYLHRSASCEACAFSSCCTEARSCATQGACAAVMSCFDGCAPDDGPCELTCWQSSGAQAASALRECLAASCATCGDPQWNCLGHVERPPPSTTTVTWNVWVQDFETLSALAAHVAFCEDAECKAPVEADTDADGHAVLTLPATSSGHLELSGGDVATSLHLPAGPTAVDRDISVLAFTPGGLAALGPLDPTLGHLVLIVRNCDGKLANGVAFALTTGDVTAEYWQDGAFGAEAATGATGAGAIFGVPVPEATVVASIASIDVEIARRVAPLRAGMLTVVQLAPE
jgi:hypothetical protein